MACRTARASDPNRRSIKVLRVRTPLVHFPLWVALALLWVAPANAASTGHSAPSSEQIADGTFGGKLAGADLTDDSRRRSTTSPTRGLDSCRHGGHIYNSAANLHLAPRFAARTTRVVERYFLRQALFARQRPARGPPILSC